MREVLGVMGALHLSQYGKENQARNIDGYGYNECGSDVSEYMYECRVEDYDDGGECRAGSSGGRGRDCGRSRSRAGRILGEVPSMVQIQ